MREINEQYVVVERALLNKLVYDVEKLKTEVERIKSEGLLYSVSLREKVLLLSDNNVIRANAICRICGWSRSTFYRKLKKYEIPAIKDGRDWCMDIDDFIEWYEKEFKVDDLKKFMKKL
jgi:excisionase family DNA binding protein